MAVEQQTAPQPNTPEARTTAGELKDQTPQDSPLAAQAADESSKTQTPPADTESKASLANDKSDETKTEKKADEKPAVPEKYEFKAPEGYEYDPKKLAELEPVFKELGLSQEGAQKLMDVAGKEIATALSAPFEAYQTQRNEWRDSLIKDPAYGNGKDNLLPSVRQDIGRVIDSLGELAPAFREAMDYTGVGDHPAFVKGIAALAKLVVEGKPASGNPPAGGQNRPSAAQAMYPHLPSAAG